MNSITDLFKQDFAPGCYILVDDKHPLKLYIGADDAGNYALEYRGVYKPTAIKPSSVIGIKHYPKSGYTCFVISFWIIPCWTLFVCSYLILLNPHEML